MWVSTPSWIARTWCIAWVTPAPTAVPIPTLTKLLTALNLFESIPITFETAELWTDVIPDCKINDLSEPSGCWSSLNLYVVFPPVVPKPTTFAETLILVVPAPTDVELSKSSVRILLCILDLNDPMKFDEKLLWDDVSA